VIKYQRWHPEKAKWVDFPEFIKFSSLPWFETSHKTYTDFMAWVTKKTTKGTKLSVELMREKVTNLKYQTRSYDVDRVKMP
jgi:hypothetical protein